jgi:hypothetical protein
LERHPPETLVRVQLLNDTGSLCEFAWSEFWPPASGGYARSENATPGDSREAQQLRITIFVHFSGKWYWPKSATRGSNSATHVDANISNTFSKKFEHHVAAVALYAARYNLCRVHETLRITPAMQVTDHVWTIGERIDAALNGELPSGTGGDMPRNLDPSDTVQSLRKRVPFSVIDGGKGKDL